MTFDRTLAECALLMRPPWTRPSGFRTGVFLWASVGVLLLVGQAIFRLAPIALEPLVSGSLSSLELGVYVSWTVLNVYLEGYRGFQTKFVPRVLARAHHLASHRTPLIQRALGPLFAMAFFGARRKAMIAAWALTSLIVVAIVVVRSLPSPWRGIIDAGVVAGLGWGAGCLLVGIVTHASGRKPKADPELGTLEISAIEIGTTEIGTAEIGTAEIGGARQISETRS